MCSDDFEIFSPFRAFLRTSSLLLAATVTALNAIEVAFFELRLYDRTRFDIYCTSF